MTAAAKTLLPAGCLFVLLCIAACDQAWSRLAGPNELGAATPTTQNEVDDGVEDPIGHDDLDCCPVECGETFTASLKGRALLCCSCTGNNCTTN